MAQQIMLSTDKNRVSVSPGAKTELWVTVQNLTALVDDVTVTVAGIDGSWVQVVPQHVPVFAQGEASVRIIFQPPVDPTLAMAGVYHPQLTGTFQEQAGQQAQTTVELEIQFGGDYRMEVGKGTAVNSQEATFPLKVHNGANAPLNLRFIGEDSQNAFWYKFEPFQLIVPPGGDAMATLSIRTRQPEAGNQKVLFTLHAQGEWTIAGMSAMEAPQQQVNGQWGKGDIPSFTVAITPPRIESAMSGNYQVVVDNPSPNEETVILEGSSASGLLAFNFQSSQIILNPQGQGTITLTVSPAATANPPGQPAVDFRVTARSISGNVRPGGAQATFVHVEQAMVKQRPSRLIPLIIVILVLLVLCAISIGILNALIRSVFGSYVSPGHLINFARSVLNGSICFYLS